MPDIELTGVCGGQATYVRDCRGARGIGKPTRGFSSPVGAHQIHMLATLAGEDRTGRRTVAEIVAAESVECGRFARLAVAEHHDALVRVAGLLGVGHGRNLWQPLVKGAGLTEVST